MPMIWLYVFLLDFLIPFLCDPGLQCGRAVVPIHLHTNGGGTDTVCVVVVFVALPNKETKKNPLFYQYTSFKYLSRLHWYGGVSVLLPGCYWKVGMEWPYNTPPGQ
jgi:hypothetical protein